MAKDKKTKTAIYHPPKKGMPYMVVTVSPRRRNGYCEIAVNQGRADRELGLSIGTPVEIVS
jgi:hypothetical protein